MEYAFVKDFIEVELKVSPDRVKEELERHGIGINKSKVLKQTCHLINITGVWYIVHYKELFNFIGKTPDWKPLDLERRNKIAKMMQKFNLVKIVNIDEIYDSYGEKVSLDEVKVFDIGYHYKNEWKIEKSFNVDKLIKDGIIDG